jgi:hypothetical protein
MGLLTSVVGRDFLSFEPLLSGDVRRGQTAPDQHAAHQFTASRQTVTLEAADLSACTPTW